MSLKSDIETILSKIVDPHSQTNLMESKSVQGLGIAEGCVSIDVRLGYPALSFEEGFAKTIQSAIEQHPDVTKAVVSVSSRIVPHKVQKQLKPLQQIKNIIAIASGKGGVGKSTTAVNLALALTAEGAKVGILDADIYGPSQPRMMGIDGRPEAIADHSILPMENHGLQTMSMGYLVDEDTAMIWRGPMVTKALQQMLAETRWRELDYLIIDLPPGTGDIQLTLAQSIPVSGAIIVTTPQDIALLDARRGLKMFEKVDVPVLGVIENMSTHVCSQCGHEEPLFGSDGGQSLASECATPFLGSIPLDIRIRQQTDSGKPTVIAEADSDIASTYRRIARNAAAMLSLQPRSMTAVFPKIVIQNK